MRVVMPTGGGPIIGEKIIYVDSPEVRKSYNAQVAALKAAHHDELTAKVKELKELQESSLRKDNQISHFAVAIQDHQTKLKAFSEIPKPDTSKFQVEISRLRAELDSVSKKKSDLTIESMNQKDKIKLLEFQVGQLSLRPKAHLMAAPAPVKEPEIIIPDAPDTFWSFLLIKKINWQHVLLFCMLLASIFYTGIRVGRG